MRLRLNKFKLKHDVDRIKMLHWSHFSFIILAILVRVQHDLSIVGSIFLIICFTLIYRLYYKTVKNIYYTFWSFSIFIGLYFSIGLIENAIYFQLGSLRYAYTLGLMLLGIECYILSSPIYFPRVRWWEYDFRYRNDLKIQAKYKKKTIEGRLTDVRRLAGCVVLFESVKVGDTFGVQIEEEEYKPLSLHAEVMSKREYSIGRGYTYGVRFSLDDIKQKQEFIELARNWKNDRLAKARLKFKNI